MNAGGAGGPCWSAVVHLQLPTTLSAAGYQRRHHQTLDGASRCCSDHVIQVISPTYTFRTRTRLFNSSCFKLFQAISSYFKLFQAISSSLIQVSSCFKLFSSCLIQVSSFSSCFKLFQAQSGPSPIQLNAIHFSLSLSLSLSLFVKK